MEEPRMKKRTRRAGRRLLIALAVCLMGVVLGTAGLNWAVDPYGVFGDRFCSWWSYNETMNPRVAKISYLERNSGRFDSYIVGSVDACAYPVDRLNEYLDASFYNCSVYEPDMEDLEEICVYLAEKLHAKNLLLSLSPDVAAPSPKRGDGLRDRQHYKVDGSGAASFYLRYLFANPLDSLRKLKRQWGDGFLPQSFRAFDAETGGRDDRRRDAEPIGGLEEYLARPAYEVFQNYAPKQRELSSLDAAERLAHIQAVCQAQGVRLTVVLAPCSAQALKNDSQGSLDIFRDALAQATDYWDFSYSSLSFDPRYFTSPKSFQSSVGSMVLGRIFGDKTVYCPKDTGRYVPLGSHPDISEASPLPQDAYTAQVPILMYHSISETGGVTGEEFEEQIKALYDAGYQTVSFQDLRRYVEEGADLPEKPLVITFDDGYRSNYLLAYPVLKKYGFQATIFAIGVSVGKDTYKDTGEAMTPHFSLEEAAEMEASGLITVASHGYNLHEVEGRDKAPIRSGALQREDETEKEYVAFLQDDCRRMRELLGDSALLMAYPYGLSSELSEAVLCREGVWTTVTIQPKMNTIVRGVPQSLRKLGRFNVGKHASGEELLQKIEGGD